jgi:GTP-binding protein
MFIDEAVITVTSGKGGDGAVHFRREKYVPRGGPDGGDGGRGGSVILEVIPTLNTLARFRYKPKFRAQDGKNGTKQNMSGLSAEDLLIQIAPGTVVYDARTGDVLGDLVEPGQRLVVCKGGRGGRGNQHFATAVNQVPRMGERGEPGQSRQLRLELKLIADVGIVGIPNAGKSTLLAAVTNAKPKIAPYPFTTLEPNLGVAMLDEDTTLILADIPGLIEGAHLGIGLGHDFLRHVQRTRVLIHLLDGMAEDPLLDLAQINSELSLFDPDLAKKPVVVALNKIDLPDVQARWPSIEAGLKKRGIKEPLCISAVTGLNVRQLMFRAAQLLKDAPPQVIVAGEELMPVYRPESDPRRFTISRENEGWRVHGEAIERAAAMTYWEYAQSVRRFQRILRSLGIEDALREAGVHEGATVFVGEYGLEWSEENKGERD